jgi:hypothetical protein
MTEKRKWLFPLICGLLGIIGGIIIGMQLQQMIFIAGIVEFGESLEGTNIEVNIDFNETKLIEGFTNSLIPVLNQSVQEKRGEKR